MARQDDELDLEKLRREVDTLTQQVGAKPTPPGTTTRLPVSYTHLTLPTNREV